MTFETGSERSGPVCAQHAGNGALPPGGLVIEPRKYMGVSLSSRACENGFETVRVEVKQALLS
jgi:hypothetical protein